MSRADQSLNRTTPKMWRSASAAGTGSPIALPVPTTKPTSASMSSRADGPKVGTGSDGDFRCPRGRTTSVPDTTTDADLPW
jgi:hypothetical protein